MWGKLAQGSQKDFGKLSKKRQIDAQQNKILLKRSEKNIAVQILKSNPTNLMKNLELKYLTRRSIEQRQLEISGIGQVIHLQNKINGSMAVKDW